MSSVLKSAHSGLHQYTVASSCHFARFHSDINGFQIRIAGVIIAAAVVLYIETSSDFPYRMYFVMWSSHRRRLCPDQSRCHYPSRAEKLDIIASSKTYIFQTWKCQVMSRIYFPRVQPHFHRLIYSSL